MQHFEEHPFCKTHAHGCFWVFLKPQNKWYNDAKIGIYVLNLHLPWRDNIIFIIYHTCYSILLPDTLLNKSKPINIDTLLNKSKPFNK